MRPSLSVVCVLGGLLFGTEWVWAQSFSATPVHIFTSELGGPSDLSARIIGNSLSAQGQQTIVENRVNVLSMELVKNAPTDGHTILVSGANFYTTPLLRPANYDPVKDFAPITIAMRPAPQVLVVHPSLQVKSVKDLIALARAKPGTLNFGSAGVGTSNDLAAELLKSMTGINIVHVPFKGTAEAATALVRGDVQIMFASGSALTAQIKAGRVIPLAVSSAGPSSLFPGLPPISSAVPGYESAQYTVVLAPGQTPSSIVETLNQEIVNALKQPEVRQQVLKAGSEVVGSTPAELASLIKVELARMSKVIKDAGIKVDD